MSVRLRYATNGFRGTTTNRRISIATMGWLPSGVLSQLWKSIITATLKLNRAIADTLQR